MRLLCDGPRCDAFVAAWWLVSGSVVLTSLVGSTVAARSRGVFIHVTSGPKSSYLVTMVTPMGSPSNSVGWNGLVIE